MLIPLTPVTRKKMFKAMVSESASLVLYRNHHGQKLAHVQSIHSTGVNGISIYLDFLKRIKVVCKEGSCIFGSKKYRAASARIKREELYGKIR